MGDVLSRMLKKVPYWKSEVAAVNMEWFSKLLSWNNLANKCSRVSSLKIISSWIEHEDLTKKMPQPLEIDVGKIP